MPANHEAKKERSTVVQGQLLECYSMMHCCDDARERSRWDMEFQAITGFCIVEWGHRFTVPLLDRSADAEVKSSLSH